MNKFDKNNDTRLAEYLNVQPKTIYDTKLKKPEIYNNLKDGWEIKCLIPTFKVDTSFSELLPAHITHERYELFWLSANKRSSSVLNAILKAKAEDYNPKLFNPNNDSRLSLYIECDKKTISNTKSKNPEIYKVLKKGWSVKCANPASSVDMSMVDMFEGVNPRWYELLMLGYGK